MKLWNYLFLVLLAVPLLLLSGCLSKKKLIKTETTTVTKVDTIIKVVKDTVLKTVSVPFYDTAYIETETATARSFYNVNTQKIELSLKGKVFDVPVKLHRTEYIKQKEIIKEPVINLGAWLYMFVILLIVLFSYVITKKIQNLIP